MTTYRSRTDAQDSRFESHRLHRVSLERVSAVGEFPSRFRIAAITVIAVSYVALYGFGATTTGIDRYGLFLYAALLNIAAGLLLGSWRTLFLPVIPAGLIFFPLGADPYEGPYWQLVLYFALANVVTVAVAVRLHKLAARGIALAKREAGVNLPPN